MFGLVIPAAGLVSFVPRVYEVLNVVNRHPRCAIARACRSPPRFSPMP